MTDKKSGLKVLKGIEQPETLNIPAIQRFRKSKKNDPGIDQIVAGIQAGDRVMLGRAITMIESSLPEHQPDAQKVIEKCLPFTGKSIRIGITGIPGVGKSTFIEALGSYLTTMGNKVAVLAVDPSSSKTKGSILGDKTRMTNLSANDNAFIRPSPSAGTLGGVARKTREAIVLCEAAGFNIILIETVGVGQSETTVHSMVDFFLVLMLPGAGDELQGIKRGIMELADLLVINKSDDHPAERIELAEQTLLNALHLMPASDSGWIAEVGHCSSVNMTGISHIWDIITKYQTFTKENNFFSLNRQKQAKYWLYDTINSELLRSFASDKKVHHRLKQFENEVLQDRISPFVAAQELLNLYLGKNSDD